MELGTLSLALVEDIAAMANFISSVESIKNQLVHEIISIRESIQKAQGETQPEINVDYYHGIHDGYVSLVQAIESLTVSQVTESGDPQNQNDSDANLMSSR